MEIRRSVEFDMAHRLPNHDGKCRRLHGHRYKVEVVIEGDHTTNPPGTSDEGMVLDFSAVDRVLDIFVKRFDHFTILHFNDPLFLLIGNAVDMTETSELDVDNNGNVYGVLGVAFVPTAERLAQHFFDMLWQQEIGVTGLTVWETPRSSAFCRMPSPVAVRNKQQRDEHGR